MITYKPGAHCSLHGQRAVCSAVSHKRHCARERKGIAPADEESGLTHSRRLLSVLPALLSLSVAGQLHASEAGPEAISTAAAAAAAAAATGSSYVPGMYVPGPVEVGWEIWFGAAAGVIPFLIASYEFGKRILIQRRCPTCKGSGLIKRGRYNRYVKCQECGGMLPWLGWSYFFFSSYGNGGPLMQPRGQTSIFYKVPPPLQLQQQQQLEATKRAGGAAAVAEAPAGAEQGNAPAGAATAAAPPSIESNK